MNRKNLADIKKLFAERELLGALSFRNKLLSKLLDLKIEKKKLTPSGIINLMEEIIFEMEGKKDGKEKK